MDELSAIFSNSDWILLPIALCLLLELGLLFERARYLRSAGMKARPFLNRIRAAVRAGDLDGAIRLAAAADGAALAQVVLAGLTRVHQGLERVGVAVHEAALVQLPSLARRLPALTGLGMLALLLGSYGTVAELYPHFHCMLAPQPVAARVIHDLRWSLGPTIFGMAVGLVAIVGRALLDAWARTIQVDVDHGVAAVINLLRDRAERGE